MERSLPNVFAPGRKVGIAAYNHNEAETITWGYGAFYANIDSDSHDRIADNQGVNLVARGTWCPVYTAGGRGVLHFGGCVNFQDLDGNEDGAGNPNHVRFRQRPEIHGTDRFANTGYLNARNFTAYDLEMASVYGPLSIQSELVYTDVDGINGTPDVDLYGAYVYASYFLTGENRVYSRTSGAFKRVKPFTNFFCVRTADGNIQSGWGAWELAARYSYLDFTKAYPVTNENLAGLLNDFTLGVNWYWNPHMRMMVNYVHSWGTSPATPGQTAETDILAARWQVDF
jgi:phosphate-selective porin OprO/OprP